MTPHYTPGWIMEARVGEHFNWCMNMQLCLIPGPEINQVDIQGLFWASPPALSYSEVRIYFSFAAVVKPRGLFPAVLPFNPTSSPPRDAERICGSCSCKWFMAWAVLLMLWFWSAVVHDEELLRVRSSLFIPSFIPVMTSAGLVLTSTCSTVNICCFSIVP